MDTDYLIPLDRHNSAVNRRHWGFQRDIPVPNGIACPQCGGELYDSAPTEIYTSDPPQKKVDCPACGYSGMRLA